MKIVIEYRVDMPSTSRTWFAKMRVKDRADLIRTLETWLYELCEHSVNDGELWDTVTFRSKKDWGTSQRWENYKSNTLLSVLSGAITKLKGGGDLTAKQLDHVKNITVVMQHFSEQNQIKSTVPDYEFLKVTDFSSTGDALEDLRNRFFE